MHTHTKLGFPSSQRRGALITIPQLLPDVFFFSFVNKLSHTPLLFPNMCRSLLDRYKVPCRAPYDCKKKGSYTYTQKEETIAVCNSNTHILHGKKKKMSVNDFTLPSVKYYNLYVCFDVKKNIPSSQLFPFAGNKKKKTINWTLYVFIGDVIDLCIKNNIRFFFLLSYVIYIILNICAICIEPQNIHNIVFFPFLHSI